MNNKSEISDRIVAAADRIHLIGLDAMKAHCALARLIGSLAALSEVVTPKVAEQLLQAVDRVLPQSPTTGAQQ